MVCEKHLIEYCAPTLASLKTGNLFRIPYGSAGELENSLQALRQQLEHKGVFVEVMHHYPNNALVYVYRPKRLHRDLHKPGVEEFLKTYGYEETSINDVLAFLKKRIVETEGFPHEIGLFLSYPLGDVIGFIENQGRNCKCVGCWKVYCDEHEARKTFDRFKKCHEIYRKLFREGKRSLYQLTVAA